MKIEQTKKFRKAIKKVSKRGKNINKLKETTRKIYHTLLERTYQDHALKGEWQGHRECHIEPDWLLVYRWEEKTLVLVDTGSHTDIFGM